MGTTVQPEYAGRQQPAIEVITFRPQPGPQWALAKCPVEDVLFGGARGGGKSYGLLLEWLGHATKHEKAARGIFFRRTYPELEEIERICSDIFPKTGARLNVGRRTWMWPNGATLRLRHLSRDEDADLYQGHSYSAIYLDEMTTFSSPVPIDKIRATLRSAAGVPCVFRASANPGGPGHNFVKARYIDPAPPLHAHYSEEAKCFRVFIPAKLDDNIALLSGDPHYWKRVEAAAAGNEALLRAWRHGDWNITAGGMFDDLWDANVHVLDPFKVPHSWKIYKAFDWGSSKPFSVGWWAIADGTVPHEGVKRLPRGSLVRIAEWYGWNGKPNEGMRMVSSEIARKILAMEEAMGYTVLPGPADLPSAQDAGMDMASDFARMGIRWEKIDSKFRIAGWQQIRRLLLAAKQVPMEEPGLFVFNTCRQFIRTVPVLSRNQENTDDADSTAEDHIADETRYMVMFRAKTAKVVQVVGN